MPATGMTRTEWAGAARFAGVGLALLFAALPLLTGPARAGAGAAGAYAGTWDLAFEKANRRCRINLTANAAPGGYAVMMPAGCHRAFPLLAGEVIWQPVESEHLVLQGRGGQALLDFAPAAGEPYMTALAGEATDAYTLTPTTEERQRALATAAPSAAAPATMSSTVQIAAAAPVASAPRASAFRPMSVGEVSGHYAVVRMHRDTGCMVTLDDKEHGPKGSLKAHLAPACADQGIVIFDPAGWKLDKDMLVLIAKKGHMVELKRQDDGTWANAPASAGARVLTLKRL